MQWNAQQASTRRYALQQGKVVVMNRWQRFRSASRKAQIGFGCGTLLVACMAFSCVGEHSRVRV